MDFTSLWPFYEFKAVLLQQTATKACSCIHTLTFVLWWQTWKLCHLWDLEHVCCDSVEMPKNFIVSVFVLLLTLLDHQNFFMESCCLTLSSHFVTNFCHQSMHTCQIDFILLKMVSNAFSVQFSSSFSRHCSFWDQDGHNATLRKAKERLHL